ncbi:MAG: ATP-binding protein [Candidatus Colwellbacteria bacterium]|nr:ATP-binding protein [Candidatus Colwellbacteria bacterium]
MINSLRSKLIGAFLVVITVFSAAIIAILISYFTIVRSYQEVSDNIFSEYKLTKATSDLVNLYSAYFKQPTGANRLAYDSKKEEIDFLITHLDTVIINKESADNYEGLKNTIYSVIEKTDAAVIAVDKGDIIGTTALLNEANHIYSFAEANATALVMKELGFAEGLQVRIERLYLFTSVGIVILFLIIIIGCFIYSISFAKKVTSPLVELTSLAEGITKGNIKLDVKKSLMDKETEIGVLAKSFNVMVKSLRKNIDRLDKAKTDLEARNEELDRLNSVLAGLKLKTEFLHIINHQLRTPISALRGYLELWRDGKFEKFAPDKQTEIKQNILIASDQLSSIVNSMVDALELEAEGKEVKLEISEIDLKKLVSDIYTADFKTQFEDKKLSFRLSSGDIPKIRSDKKYLESIIGNLIDNGLKYTNKGGIDISLSSSDKNVIIEVRDTGIGLTESDKARVFQKFVRSEEAVKLSPGGSGLGLYIAKRMVDILKGDIEVSSEGRGKGTAFVVKLPIISS